MGLLNTKRFFTSEQINRFFQAAICINIIGLISDIIGYHYFPDNDLIKITNQNLSNLSIAMICLVLISKAILLFIQRHKSLITKHKLLAITCIIFLANVLYLFLHIDNDIQESFVIYFSNISATNHDYRITLLLIGLLGMLIFNFYRNVQKPEHINAKSVPTLLRSTFNLVIKEYLFIIVALLGIFRITYFKNFAVQIIEYSKATLHAQIMFIKIMIPISWVCIVGYYMYTKHLKTK